MHFVHVDDVVLALEKVVEKPEKSIGETFIVAGDEYLRMREVCEIISIEANIKPPWIRLPMMPFYTLGLLFEAICFPLKINPPISRNRFRFFTNDRGFDTSKIQKKLGFKPLIQNRVGLKEVTRTYLEKNWI